MNLTIFEKIATIFKYTFSSFLSIELLLLSLLLFVLLIVNLKRKEKIIPYAAIIIYLGLLLGALIAYNEYVLLSIKEFFKTIITFICFPTTAAFFTTIAFITIVMIYSLFSNKLSDFKKAINYLFFSILYFFFTSFIVLTAFHNIDLSSSVALYSNNYVLAIVQGSNTLLIIWIVFTLFYRWYQYLKEKLD